MGVDVPHRHAHHDHRDAVQGGAHPVSYTHLNSSNNKVLRNTPDSIKHILFSDNWKQTPLPASPIIRMAGAYLDFDKLIRLGLPGMRAEVTAYREKAEQEGGDAVLLSLIHI